MLELPLMSVFKRGKVVWYKFTWNGQIVRESTRQSKKRVAEELEAAHRTRLARGEAGLLTHKQRLTFVDYAVTFVRFVETRSAEKPATIKFYKACVRRLLEFPPLASARLQDVDEAIIELYIQHRRLTVQPSAIDRELATLRRMLKLAVEKWKLLARRPLVALLHRDRNRDYVLSRPDEGRYLVHTTGRLHLAAVVLIDTGLRIGELVALRWTDFDWMEHTIHVRKGKTVNARRTLNMTARCQAELVAWSSISPRGADAFVFGGRAEGTHISISTMEKLHVAARERLELPREFVIHSLRHTFGTRLGELGTDVFTIKDLMGHSNVTVSQKYVHPGDATRRAAFSRLDAANVQAMGTISGTEPAPPAAGDEEQKE
jgi:integrase